MKEFDFHYIAPICEQPNLTFRSTGLCGGDAGHGGDAFLRLSMPDGGNGFILTTKDRYGAVATQEGAAEVTIEVCGDWEIDGLAVALLELGRALLARDDMLEARAHWCPPQHRSVPA